MTSGSSQSELLPGGLSLGAFADAGAMQLEVQPLGGLVAAELVVLFAEDMGSLAGSCVGSTGRARLLQQVQFGSRHGQKT